MNWKETLFILAALTAIVGFSHVNLSMRMSGMESKIDNLIEKFDSKIDNLIEKFDKDRRTMTQRIDNLYEIQSKKQK